MTKVMFGGTHRRALGDQILQQVVVLVPVLLGHLVSREDPVTTAVSALRAWPRDATVVMVDRHSGPQSLEPSPSTNCPP
jgi:hypothetical protein